MRKRALLPPALERIGKIGPGVFLAGIISFIICMLYMRNTNGPEYVNTHWIQFYLYAWVITMGYSLGCYGFMLLHYVVKGSWGYPVIRIWEAGARLLPLMGVLWLPIWYFAPLLYPWAQPHITDPAMLHRAAYMNSMSVLVRAIFYFAFWIGTTYHLTGVSRRIEETRDVSMLRARTNLSSFLLVIFVLTVNFAVTDWVMSLEMHWYSTLFGLWFVVSETICAVGLVAILTTLLRNDEPYKAVIDNSVRKDYGNLMLLAVMFWGYFSFSQWVIIWSGNLPDEIIFYLHRFTDYWLYVGAFIVIFQFFGPFVLLLSGKTKRYPLLVAGIASWLLFMRLVDIGWTIFPSFQASNPIYIPIGITLVLAFMGAWITLLVQQLRGVQLISHVIPEPVEEVLNHA